MVLKLPNNSSTLSAPPLFDFMDFKVMASWPNLDKACPQCKTVGHDSRGCPRHPITKKPTASKSRNRYCGDCAMGCISNYAIIHQQLIFRLPTLPQKSKWILKS